MILKSPALSAETLPVSHFFASSELAPVGACAGGAAGATGATQAARANPVAAVVESLRKLRRLNLRESFIVFSFFMR
jgi:hypothetical protein